MKNFFVVIVIFFSSCLFGENINNPNIVELYKLLPFDEELAIYSGVKDYLYRIDNVKGSYSADSLSYAKKIKIFPQVDDVNGYLFINDKVYNNASIARVEHEVAKFISNKKNIFLGVSFRYYRDIGYSYFNKFYKYENGKLVDVTSKILPEISLNIFLKNKYSNAQIEKVSSVITKRDIKFIMPRYGTSIKVVLDTSIYSYFVKTNNFPIPNNKEIIINFLSNIDSNSKELKWNEGKEIFEFVAK